MNSFADALREVNTLKEEGLIREYAVAGAMAMVSGPSRCLPMTSTSSCPFRSKQGG